MYYNINKHKEFFFLDLFVYLIPLSIVFGNLILNSLIFISTIIFYSLIFIKRNFYHKYKKYFLPLFVFITILVLNFLFSNNSKATLIATLNFFKNYSLFFIIFFCFIEIDNFKKLFSKILLFTILFVIFDILFQHFFLVDIFGYEISSSHGRRLSGPFGDEGVAGSFISKLFFISILFIINKNYFKNLLFPLIMLSLITVILTNERSASIMFFLAIIIFFMFYEFKIIYKFIALISSIFILILIFNYNSNLRAHFIDIPIKVFKDNHHMAHFLTAIEIYKNNKLLGSGLKSFRNECKKSKYENINSKFTKNRCSTHPHNIYLEILSETGLLGFIFILLINLYILQYLIFNFFKKKSYKNEILVLFCNFFLLFWPVQTTGAFFSTWNGVFYWIFFSYFFYLKKKLTT